MPSAADARVSLTDIGEPGSFMVMSDMELYRRLGRAVAERRGELGFTQGDVAERIGLSRASLANLENGRQRIMVHQLFGLVNALKLKSILELVPDTWMSGEPLPKVRVSGSTLSSQERATVQGVVASALAGNLPKKRSR